MGIIYWDTRLEWRVRVGDGPPRVNTTFGLYQVCVRTTQCIRKSRPLIFPIPWKICFPPHFDRNTLHLSCKGPRSTSPLHPSYRAASSLEHAHLSTTTSALLLPSHLHHTHRDGYPQKSRHLPPNPTNLVSPPNLLEIFHPRTSPPLPAPTSPPHKLTLPSFSFPSSTGNPNPTPHNMVPNGQDLDPQLPLQPPGPPQLDLYGALRPDHPRHHHVLRLRLPFHPL